MNGSHSVLYIAYYHHSRRSCINTSTMLFDVFVLFYSSCGCKRIIWSIWIWSIVAATKANHKHEIGGDRMRRVTRPKHTAVASNPHSWCPVGGHLCPDQRNTNPRETLWKLVGAHARRAHSLYIPGAPSNPPHSFNFFIF